jgi:hypothetical protein
MASNSLAISGVCVVDDDETVFIVDSRNDRIVALKVDTQDQLMAESQRLRNGLSQLSFSTDELIDKVAAGIDELYDDL